MATMRHLLGHLAVFYISISAELADASPLEASLNKTDTPAYAAPFSPAVMAAISPPSGYTNTLFADDFRGLSAGSLPSADRWTVKTGTSYPGGPANWGTGEVESYTTDAANLQVTSGSTLLVTPQRSADGGHWTSGRIESVPSHDFACKPGHKLRIEARLRLGGASEAASGGIWPAFWTLGSSFRTTGAYQTWPAVGEIDILEVVNGEGASHQTLHCGAAQGGPCNEPVGLTTKVPLVSPDDWHVYSVEIDRTAGGGAESISWLVDGQRTASVSAAAVNDGSAWEALAHTSKYLILNVAVGGGFPNAFASGSTPNAATMGGSGAALEVQYVGVFST